jgi:hypothetical protein
MLAPAWKERVMTVDDGLVAALPAVARLALVYAPASARQQTLALDARLATLIRRSSEPMLAQLRLAWWREAIAQDPARWPQGEPVLATLRSWGPRAGEVTVLVDGWEALTAPAPLSSAQIAAFAQGRADAAAALALTLGRPQDVEAALACAWRERTSAPPHSRWQTHKVRSDGSAAPCGPCACWPACRAAVVWPGERKAQPRPPLSSRR